MFSPDTVECVQYMAVFTFSKPELQLIGVFNTSVSEDGSPIKLGLLSLYTSGTEDWCIQSNSILAYSLPVIHGSLTF